MAPCLHFTKEGASDRVPLPQDCLNLLQSQDRAEELPRIADASLLNHRGSWSKLHLAAYGGQPEAMQRTLDEGKADLNREDEVGNTPLHLAVRLGHKKVVQLLVDAGASQSALNKDKMMPVSYCCNTDMFDALLHKEVTNPACVDTCDKTVLHYASYYAADANILSGLISSLKTSGQLRKRDNYGDTFLHVAAKAGNMRVLEALKILGPFSVDNPFLVSDENPQNSPALVALLHGHRDFFDELATMATVKITLGCIIEALVMELIGNPQIPQKLELFVSTLPTYLALFANKFCVFDFILETNILTISQWDSETKRTCLHWAVIHRRVDILKKLCQNVHLRPDIQDIDGKTAMQHAFEQKNHVVWETVRAQPCFKEHEEKLYRDREVYVQCLNAILVGAALIGSVTFAGWLQLPSDPMSKSMELKVFWASNSLSFYTAVATMCVTTAVLIPTPSMYVGGIVNYLRLAIVLDASLLALSLGAVMLAFAAAGFAALQHSHIFQYRCIMWVTTVVGGSLCLLTWAGFVLQLYRSTPSLSSVFGSLISFAPFSRLVPRQAFIRNILGDAGDHTRSCFSNTEITEVSDRELLSNRTKQLAPVVPAIDVVKGHLQKLGIPNKDGFIEQFKLKQNDLNDKIQMEKETSDILREFHNYIPENSAKSSNPSK